MDQINDYSVYNTPPYLLQQLVDTDVSKILQISDTQFTQFEDLSFDFFSEIWLTNAVGWQLDVLGIHLGLERMGRSDAEYKQLLQVKGSLNKNSGTPEQIMATLRAIYSAGTIFFKQQQYQKIDYNSFSIDYILNQITINGKVYQWCPATIEIETDADISYSNLEKLLPAGVRGLFLADLLQSRTDETSTITDVYDEDIYCVKGV